MRGRLLLLSGGSSQTITLPLIDGGEVPGPAVFSDQAFDLPLIDGGEVLAPTVFLAGTIDLPLIDGGEVLAPTLTGAVTATLPLIDGGEVLAPSVFVEQEVDLPLIDGGEVLAPSFLQDQSLTLPLIDGGWAFGPVVTGQVVAGLAVYLVQPGADLLLEPATVPTFRDVIDDVGSFTLTLANDDPDLALCVTNAVVRFEVEGIPAFSGIIKEREVIHLAPGEEHDHVTALSGPGFLGVAANDVVYPSLGVRRRPIEEVRSFAWPSLDFDFSGAPFAKKVNRQREYATWRTPLPAAWPDTEAWWICPDRADFTHVSAPTGAHLYWRSFTLADDVRVRIFGAGDNSLVAYLDGAQIIEMRSFIEAEYVEVDLTAGTHLIAARGNNYPKATLPNPTGIIMAAYEVGDSNLLGDLVFHTDHTWRSIYIGSDAPPGFTPGEVLYLLRDETDIFDDVTFEFTETLASDGRPWEEHPEITVQVGRSYLEMLREMAASGILDVAAAPGAPVIRAWNYGTRGVTRTTTLTQTAGDPDASEFLQLRHKGHDTRLNKALIRTAEGWTERIDTASQTAYGTRGGLVPVGHVQSHEEGEAVAATIMDRRDEPVYSTTGRILPSGDDTTPYLSYENGDYVPCLDEDGVATAQRVRAITLDPDEVGVLEWGLELREIELEREELHQNALKRAAEGHLIAGARVASPPGSPSMSAQRVVLIDVSEFSMHDAEGNLPTGMGIARRAVRSGNAVEIAVTLTLVDDGVPTTTATTCRVYLNGSLLGTVTVPAGEDEGETALDREAVRANLDRLRPELVTVAAEVAGVDITVRAI